MFDMNMLNGMMGGGGNMAGNMNDAKKPDTSEQIIVSSLALLKMLKHGRAGVPLEVMGLMLGTFVDEYTTKVVDVFAMPQSGTGVSVEAVDPVFQSNMLEMLKQTDRPENVVGWYHSHPGFGCWLSSVDVNTQQSFEQLEKRNVAVVIDPIQSVKGKVVIDAFRLIDPKMTMLGVEPRQTTSNVGLIKKPNVQAMFRGLDKYYFSLNVNFRKNEYEAKMLSNLYKKKWFSGLKMRTFEEHSKDNEETMKDMSRLAKSYSAWIDEESKMTQEEFEVWKVGRINPKKHLKMYAEEMMNRNVNQNLGLMLNSKALS